MRTRSLVFSFFTALVLALMPSDALAQQRTMALQLQAERPVPASTISQPSLAEQRAAQAHQILQGLQRNDYRDLRRALLASRRIVAVADIRRVHRLYLAELGPMTGYTLHEPTSTTETGAQLVTIHFENGTQAFKLNWYNDVLTSLIKAKH